MNSPLNDSYQSMAANAICHAASMAGEAIQQAAYCHSEPSVLYRPSLSVDGNQWCALYGEDLQSGVAGFADSPAKAMEDFDKQWNTKIGTAS